MQNVTRPLVAGLALALVAVPLAGCAHVKRSEFETEMTRLETELRDEVRAGDAELGARVDSLGDRVDRVQTHLADLDARTVTLETDLQSLATDVGATVQRLENAIAFNAPVFFDYDSAAVREQDHALLARFAEVVRGYYPHSLITDEGFTDPAGSPAYNQKLGERRADAVKQVLVSQGVEPERLRTVSYGEERARLVDPGASGPGEAGRLNRRVALVIETSTADWDITDLES